MDVIFCRVHVQWSNFLNPCFSISTIMSIIILFVCQVEMVETMEILHHRLYKIMVRSLEG